MSGTNEYLAELGEQDEEYNPQVRRPYFETLDHGTYEFVVLDAAIDKVESNGKLVLRLGLDVLNMPGTAVDFTYWLDNSVAKSICGSDLCQLGFEQHMGPGNKFSDGLGKVLPLLKGVKFRAKKHPDKKDPKFTRMSILGLIRSGNGPKTFHQPQAAPAGTPSGAAAATGQGGKEEEIPF